MIFVIFSSSLTRFRCRPFLLFVVRLGVSENVGRSMFIAGVGMFVVRDGVGTLGVGC